MVRLGGVRFFILVYLVSCSVVLHHYCAERERNQTFHLFRRPFSFTYRDFKPNLVDPIDQETSKEIRECDFEKKNKNKKGKEEDFYFYSLLKKKVARLIFSVF